MDLDQIQSLLMGELNNNQPYKDYVSSASANINNLTRKRVRDLLSKYSTTGLGRSGISGAALNGVYSTAGQNLSNVAAQGATMQAQNRQQILSQMLGLAEYQDSKPGFGSILGQLISGGAQVGAAALLGQSKG